MKRAYSRFVRLLTIFAYPVSGLILHNSRRARVVVLAEGQILLQRTSVGSQRWSLPGGGVMKKESDKQAAIREVAEEVGLTLTAKQLIYLGEDYRAELGHKGWPKFTRVYFLAELDKKVSPTITRPLEILEVKWFSLTDLPKEDNQTLKAALTLLNQRPAQL